MVALTDQVKRRVGQHFVLGFTGYEINDNVTSLIRDYHVGNIIIMKRNVQDIHQLRRLISRLQQIAKQSGHAQPLMIGIDQENGLVSAFSTSTPTGGTHFPGAMALASTGSPQIAQDVSAATAKEMRLAGINWAYSPVADVNSDSRNPVIGVRSYGDNPAEVAEYVAAVSRGLLSEGIAPCAKHFPGHGDTHVDSHLGLPKINKDLNQLQETELVPFKRLVGLDSLSSEPIPSIMMGHMALPIVNNDDRPCSLSSRIVKNLLRGQLGFEGVVVTDCLEMDAVINSFGTEGGAVESLKAGTDIVMICHTYDRQVGAIKKAYEAIETGDLSLSELETSEERIRTFKSRFAGSWGEVLPEVIPSSISLDKLKVESLDRSRQAYDRSIAIIRDPKKVLPFDLPLNASNDQPHDKNPGPPTNVLLFTPEMEVLNRAVDDAENIIRSKDGKHVRNTAGPSYEAFSDNIKSRTSTKSVLYEHVVYSRMDVAEIGTIALPDSVLSSFQNASQTKVIFATRNADRSTWQIEYLVALLSNLPSSNVKVCVLATCGPYDLLESSALGSISKKENDMLEEVAYVASFEFTVQALEASARVIFGDVEATGKCPVHV